MISAKSATPFMEESNLKGEIRMKKENKLVEFIKTHKTAVITAIGAVVAGGVTLALMRRNAKLEGLGNIPIPELEIGEILMLWKERCKTEGYPKCVNAIGHKVTVADLGALGQELTKIEGITPTSPAEFVLTILTK